MQILRWLITFALPVACLEMLPSNLTSIFDAQNTVIKGMLVYCPWIHNVSGSTPGMFQAPYYWWEAGVAWSAMIDWSVVSGNDTYNDWIKEAIQFQSGTNWDFMTENQTSVEGNDDQGFWGITVMNAAEKNFTQPDKGYPPWLYFAQATFNKIAGRWDTTLCGGGLKWQIFPWNAGYDYKNMVSNGVLFHMAARLARFTNNDSYVDWSEKVWKWARGVNFLSPIYPDATNNFDMYMRVYDGAHTTDNCTDIATAEWTYDQGLMISGCAYLYNYTGDSVWLDRVDQLWSRATSMFGTDNSTYFPGSKILYEPSCMTADESIVSCSNDQRVFKGIMLRFLGISMQVAPVLRETFFEYITITAPAASWSCFGGTDGVSCGLSWLHQGWDGWYGRGEQICALDAFNTLIYDRFDGPYKASDLPEIYTVNNSTSSGSNSSDSGSSSGNSSSGSSGTVYGWGNEAGMNSSQVESQKLDLDNGDVAGAGVLTAFVLLLIIGGSAWLVL